MKIIFALGNPESNYASSRHNVGFASLDRFAREANLQFSEKAKFFSYIAQGEAGSEKFLLVKPTTFYNQTGQAARALADFYKLTAEDFLVVHDDLALPFGSIRTRQGGESAGNNGLKSISSHLGKDTWRLRIGIANQLSSSIDDAKFVLGSFSKDEKEFLNKDLLPLSCQLVSDFIDGSLEATTYKLGS